MVNKKNRKQYAEEQFELGWACYQEGEPDKAIEYWNAIERENDKELYAQAQFNLGLFYRKEDEIVKAIEFWSTIQREDDKKLYAQAQFNLGLFYLKEDEIVKAIEFFSAIQREDDKQAYAQAQFSLGVIAYKEQKELAKAFEHRKVTQQEDDRERYIKVIEHWSAIQREDDAKQYAQVQFNLGVLYQEQGELAKAVEHWCNIQREDDKEQYAKAQLSLGVVCYNQDKLDEAKEYTNAAFAQQEDNVLKASILLGKITILQTYAKSKNGEDYTYFKQKLDNIDNVDEIVELLIVSFEEGKPERKVATYTTVRVAKLFIEKAEKSFHLNIANRMNDTTEGQNLFKWMGYAENTETTNTIYGFLTSFTFNHNSLNQFRLYGKTEDKEGTGVSFVVSTDIFSDKHSGNNIELNTDISMVGIRSDAKRQDNQDEDKNNKLITEKIPLYRCIYINPDNGYVSLARRSRYSFFLEHGDLDEAENADKQTAYNEYKEKIDEAEVKVRAKLIAIRENYREIHNILKMDEEELKAQLTDINADREEIHKDLAKKQQLRQQTDQLIRKILLPLCFLTKHASFEEEAECRIIYITDIANEKVTFENNRLFLAYGVPVLDRQTNKTYLNKIYLGPKVEDVVKIELQHLYYQQGIKAPIRIEKSNLPLA